MSRPQVRCRRGMVLPVVMIGMLLASTMAAALQLAAWRAQRGAQGQWDAQRAAYVADGAVTRAIARWALDSLAAIPIGRRVVTTESTADGWRVTITVTRSTNTAVVVNAVARREHEGPLFGGTVRDGARIRKRVTRTVRLEPPQLPVWGAGTVLGHATLGAAVFDGRDIARPFDAILEDCGPWRDTASVAALTAVTWAAHDSVVAYGAMPALTAASVSVAQQRFDSTFAVVVARAASITQSGPGPLAPSAPWRARVMRAADTVIVDGTSTHVGLLAIDGDLDVRGTLRVHGLLLVRGALRVSGGALQVDGALVVRDASTRGSSFSATTRVAYAPCLWRRALIPVAMVRTSAFGVWNGP